MLAGSPYELQENFADFVPYEYSFHHQLGIHEREMVQKTMEEVLYMQLRHLQYTSQMWFLETNLEKVIWKALVKSTVVVMD